MTEKIKLKSGQVDEVAAAKREIIKNITANGEDPYTELGLYSDAGAFLELRSDQVKSIHVRIYGPRAMALFEIIRERRGITSDQDLIRQALCLLAVHTLKRRGENGKLVRVAH